jgi:hypothetical protein
VQNLFLEVDMAFQAFIDMWDGKKPEKLLLDPGFVITQDNLEEAGRDVGLHRLEAAERLSRINAPPRRGLVAAPSVSPAYERFLT